MGFEVKYAYYERLEDGSYDKANPKEMVRKVGDPFEDVSLDKLASIIMAQLARRDVWVLPEPEVYELKKQKVSVRDTKGGLIIKNKKFFLDSENNTVVSQDISPEAPPTQQALVAAPHNNLPVHAQQAAMPKRPIKFVMLDDVGVTQDASGARVPIMVAIKKSGLQFRPGQRYAVLREMDDPRDKRVDKHGAPALDRRKVYMILDDLQRELMVSQDYFVPADIKLEKSLADDPWETSGRSKGPKLMYEGEENVAMPDLRSRK